MAKRLVDGQRRQIREQMFLHEPTNPQWLSLNLTPEEKERAVKLVLYLWLEYLPKNFWAWIWCLAIDGVRPRKRGNKPKWSGIDGDHFELEVDTYRWSLGDKRESISDSIRAVMMANPGLYGIVNDNTVETMRQNYYKIQRRIFGTENKRKKGIVSAMKSKRASPK
jgi:hypothetical protein